MPWKEVIRLLLKQKLAVACFAVIVISTFLAVTANWFVSDFDLQANPGVDNLKTLTQFEKSRMATESDDPDFKPDDTDVADIVAAEEESLTGLERSYHPPGWWLAISPDHEHWKKTGKNAETTKKNPPIAEDKRDWEFFSAKAWRFPLGCDIEGKPIQYKLLRGLRLAFVIGLIPTLISSIIAVVMGLTAGYFGKWIDDAIIYLISTLASIPLLLLLLAFIQAVAGWEEFQDWIAEYGADDKAWRNLILVLVVIGLTTWIGLSRLVRAEVIKHKNREYVHAARALGYGTPRILFKHILPNVFHLVIITFTLGFVGAIGLEVFLSYVGIGVESSLPTWGQMITGGRLELQRDVWWPLTFATVALFIVSLAFSLFGDALRDALDPKLRT
ncbi:MAG: ABC transporter permease [Planctomycetota bacterium]|jgi:peptide/nickel transport system permease protein